ncbi:serine/threonine-protein phosphatase 7 long form-like protein, partial [Trifolium medium]|nr:serine/threonine-protein phosphatase 7 long form-like protein [Trifolium medium]
EGPSRTECILPPADPAEFPGGPKDTSVLTSHGRKMKLLDIEVPEEQWFRERLAVTGLEDLAKIGYQHLDLCLISALAERWHEEASSFHMPAGEITVTLDDVS